MRAQAQTATARYLYRDRVPKVFIVCLDDLISQAAFQVASASVSFTCICASSHAP